MPLRTDALDALMTARLVLTYALERDGVDGGDLLADPVRVDPTSDGWIFGLPGGIALGVIDVDVDGDERRAVLWHARVTRAGIDSRLYTRTGRLLRADSEPSAEMVRLDRALTPPPHPELN